MSDSLIFILLVFGYIFGTIHQLREARSVMKDLKKINNELRPLEESQEVKKDELESVKEPKEVKPLDIKRFRLFVTISVIFFIVTILFGIYMGSKLTISKGLIAEFNQKLNAISPSLSDLEIKQLKSKWALMQNVSDFNIINTLINSYAKEAKIVLPKSVYFL